MGVQPSMLPANINLIAVHATPKVLGMGTNIGHKEKVRNGTCSEDSMTLYLSSLQVPQDIVLLLLICILVVETNLIVVKTPIWVGKYDYNKQKIPCCESQVG